MEIKNVLKTKTLLKFDKILRKTEKTFFEGETSELLNSDKFVAKMALVKSKLGYDFLSTSGYLLINADLTIFL